MHTEIDYGKIPDADARALKDVQSFLGAERFNNIVEKLKDSPKQTPWKFLVLLDMFLGISGFPVRVFYNHIYDENLSQEDFKKEISSAFKAIEETIEAVEKLKN